MDVSDELKGDIQLIKRELIGLDKDIFTLDQIEKGFKLSGVPIFGSFSEGICLLAIVGVKIPIKVAKAAREGIQIGNEKDLALEVSKSAAFNANTDDCVYKNVITIHENIKKIRKTLNDMGIFLVASLKKIGGNRQLQNRQLQLSFCESTLAGYKLGCIKPSCENPERIGDGSYNFAYIANLEGGEL